MRRTEKPRIPPAMPDDSDVMKAMREFGSFLDITPDDFRELYTKAYAEARARFFEERTAAQIMSTPVLSIRPSMTCADAVRFFDEHNISGAPVALEDGQIVGVLSETDIARLVGGTRRPSPMHLLKAVLEKPIEPNALSVPVDTIMTKEAICVQKETSLAAMLDIIHTKAINRLPVIDADKKLVGIVSRTDLLNTLGFF
ncbi:MAG: CBS domain-containing protein [Desulfovibrionaceae bacterium]|nr:CBS domain-containing protein [Desulfovibrionaceae bacterium]